MEIDLLTTDCQPWNQSRAHLRAHRTSAVSPADEILPTAVRLHVSISVHLGLMYKPQALQVGLQNIALSKAQCADNETDFGPNQRKLVITSQPNPGTQIAVEVV
jgi:hypothetical protein